MFTGCSCAPHPTVVAFKAPKVTTSYSFAPFAGRLRLARLRDLCARGSRHALRRRAGGHDPHRPRREDRRHVPRHPQPRQERRRAGPALDGVQPAVRDEPPVLRLVHRRARELAHRPLHGRERPRRALERPHPPRSSTSRTRTTTAASSSSTSAAISTSGSATEAPAGIPNQYAQNMHVAARQAAAREGEDAGPLLEDRRARSAQPVALLVRPGERQPLDRRRRPGHVGGGRLSGRGEARQARELRLEPLRGLLGLRREPPLRQGRPEGEAGHRLLARARLLDQRRLRLSRRSGAGRARAVLLRRLLQRERSGASGSASTDVPRAAAVVGERRRPSRRSASDGHGELYAVSLGGTLYKLR